MVKKAILIGCNYEGTKFELKGCINDVYRMRECLVKRYGFKEENIIVLVDNGESQAMPTGLNIRQAMVDMIDGANTGDVFFIQYSGHGIRLPSPEEDADETGYDECIVPCDMNLIADDDFREFVKMIPKGCKFTMVADSCHSGGLIQNEKEQIGNSTLHHLHCEHNEKIEENKHRDHEHKDDIFSSSVSEADLSNNNNSGSILENDLSNKNSNSQGISFHGFGDGNEINQPPRHKESDHPNHRLDPKIEDENNHHNHRRRDKMKKAWGDMLGFRHRHRHHEAQEQEDERKPQSNRKKGLWFFKNREIPMHMFVEVLQEKTGKTDMDVKDVRSTLSDLFGGDHGSPVAKKFLKALVNKWKIDGKGTEGVKLLGLATSLVTTQLHKHENSINIIEEGETSTTLGIGVLISGCQSGETSADANFPDSEESFGAMSNAIQTILNESEQEEVMTNRKLVTWAQELLQIQGLKQHPGLYCSDKLRDAPFIC